MKIHILISKAILSYKIVNNCNLSINIKQSNIMKCIIQ